MTYDEMGMPYGNPDPSFVNQLADPRFQGLATLASGLLQQSGWQPRRVGLGEAFGGAGLQALQAMSQARRQQIELENAIQMRAYRQAEMAHLYNTMRQQQQERQQFGQFQNLVGGMGNVDLSQYGGPPAQTATVPQGQIPVQQSQQVPFQQQMEQNLLGPFASTQAALPQSEVSFQYQLGNSGNATTPPVTTVGKEPWNALNAQADYLEQKSSFITDPTVAQRAQQYVQALRTRADRLQQQATGTVLQQHVKSLVKSGVPEEYANGIAAGRYTVSINPINNERQVIDVYTGKPVYKDTLPQDVTPPETAIKSDVKVPLGTGPYGFFSNIANTIKGALGMPMGHPEVQKAINALTNLNVQTTSLLQQAVPGRPSVSLMKRLGVLTVEPASLLQNDERSQLQLQQTRDMINVEVNRMQRDILNQAKLFKPEQVTETRLNHGQLKQLLREYDQVLSSFKPGATSSSSVPTATNPNTGEKAEFRNGQWQIVK